MSTPIRPLRGQVQERFDALSSLYRFECAHGIPTSVRKRYEMRLAYLRKDLRKSETSCLLGQVLLRVGAIDEKRLAKALVLQQEGGKKKLLGELLIDLGWVDEQTIRRAVNEQRIGAEKRRQPSLPATEQVSEQGGSG